MQNLDKRKISAKKVQHRMSSKCRPRGRDRQSWASSQYTILRNFGYIVHVTQSKGMTHSSDYSSEIESETDSESRSSVISEAEKFLGAVM